MYSHLELPVVLPFDTLLDVQGLHLLQDDLKLSPETLNFLIFLKYLLGKLLSLLVEFFSYCLNFHLRCLAKGAAHFLEAALLQRFLVLQG